MFKIESTHVLKFPSVNLKLVKGENAFTSESKIPAEAWSALERMKKAGILKFERSGKPVAEQLPKLDELDEAALYDMPKDELAALAKRSDVAVEEGASKKTLLDALMASKAPATDEDVELSAEALGKLNFKQLQELAAEVGVDVEGLRSKQEIVDRLLADAAEGESDATQS